MTREAKLKKLFDFIVTGSEKKFEWGEFVCRDLLEIIQSRERRAFEAGRQQYTETNFAFLGTEPIGESSYESYDDFEHYLKSEEYKNE